MKLVLCVVGALSLTGCAAIKEIAPQTAAGFATGGVLGALDGASGAILARCQTLDGSMVRVAVDNLAVETGQGRLIDRVRGARERACRIASNVSVFVD